MSEKQTIACTNPRCENGTTIERQYLEKLVFLILVAGSDSVKRGDRAGRRHPYFDVIDELIGLNGVVNESMAELTGGLAGRPPSFMGHDSLDNGAAVEKIIKAAGLPEKWGYCPTCNGHGYLEV